MKKSDYEFGQPYITEFIFRINEEFKTEVGNIINLETKIQGYNDFEPSEGKKNSIAGLRIVIGSESEDAPFYIKLNIEARFSWGDKSIDDVRSFLKVNASSLLIGYARPVISFITSNSPFPPFNLSFINFTDDENE